MFQNILCNFYKMKLVIYISLAQTSKRTEVLRIHNSSQVGVSMSSSSGRFGWVDPRGLARLKRMSNNYSFALIIVVYLGNTDTPETV